MLKRYKQFFLGFLIASLIFCSITVFADVTEIKAFLSDIKITLNGQTIELKDTNGEKIMPIVYNGTTYLPVKPIAEAFGKEVSYNTFTNTVRIVDKPVEKILPELKPVGLAPNEIGPMWESHNANPVKDTILQTSESFKDSGFMLTLNEIIKKDNILTFHFYYENNTDKPIQKYRMVNAVSDDGKYKSVSTILVDTNTEISIGFGYPANSKGDLFVAVVEHEEYKYIELTNYNIKWLIR